MLQLPETSLPTGIIYTETDPWLSKAQGAGESAPPTNPLAKK